MRMSDWSSDVCSSDLRAGGPGDHAAERCAEAGTRQCFDSRQSGLGALVVRDGSRGRTRLSGQGASPGAGQRRDKVALGSDEPLIRRSAAAQIRIRRSRVAAQAPTCAAGGTSRRSEEHTSDLQSLMRLSYAVFCLKKPKNTTTY